MSYNLFVEFEMVVGTLRRRHSVALAYMDSADYATVRRYYVVLTGLGRYFTRIELFHIGFPSLYFYYLSFYTILYK